MSLSPNLTKRIIQLQDPWLFLKYCAFTQDEVDVLAPVKPAPSDRGYLYLATRLWQSRDKMIVDKSRRMFISWWALIMHLHLAFTNTNRRVAIISKKFDDSCAHLENMRFIWENIPEDLYPADLRPKMRFKEGYIYFDEIGSTIHALASGPDQARQYGFSAAFCDEMDFWDEQEGTFAALKPTLAGGGKLLIATTHAPQSTGEDSFYKLLLEDRLGEHEAH